MTDEKKIYEQKIKGLEKEITYLNNQVDWYKGLYQDYCDTVAKQLDIITELMERLERSKI